MKTLKIQGLVKSYKRRRVVDDVNLEVGQGEVVGLLGPNGAGKTTTFYMVVGLVKPDRGRILIDDFDLSKLPMYKRARKGVGYLAQEPSIFRKLTVEENILAILETLNLGEQEKANRLKKLLAELNISHLAKNRAYTLSGGERRRVEITRALVTAPSFILLDEPFTGIDPIAIADIQEIIFQLKKKGIGILITDRAYIMYEGEILISGTSQELANSKEAREIYLGEKFTLE
jgi:lipopolysaccharide export system ATP-binding protein